MRKIKSMACKAALTGLLFFWSIASACGQTADTYTFQQLDSLQRTKKKPVLVFIHTSWCRYCQAMVETTFQNKMVKELLNMHFYFIELNAEAKQDITVHGHTFRYLPTGNGAGQHELARELGMVEGQISFPTLTFLNADYEIIYQKTGFVNAKALAKTLQKLHSK